MKAMLLAAGVGSRLGTLTGDTPKCLMEVGGRKMLDFVVDNLKRCGVTSIAINLHHHGEKIKSHVKNEKSFGINVEFSEEEALLGTGGGLKNVARFFEHEKDFFLHNADVYTDLNLRKLLDFHRSQGALATLWVRERKTSRPLLFDKGMNLVGWEVGDDNKELVENHLPESRLAFTGVQVISPRIFEYMQQEAGNFSIIRAYINTVRAGQSVIGFKENSSYWIDMGTPKGLEELRRHLSPS